MQTHSFDMLNPATKLINTYFSLNKAMKLTEQLQEQVPMGVLKFEGMLLSMPSSFI